MASVLRFSPSEDVLSQIGDFADAGATWTEKIFLDGKSCPIGNFAKRFLFSRAAFDSFSPFVGWCLHLPSSSVARHPSIPSSIRPIRAGG